MIIKVWKRNEGNHYLWNNSVVILSTIVTAAMLEVYYMLANCVCVQIYIGRNTRPAK